MITVTQLDGFGTKTKIHLSKSSIVYATQNVQNERLDSIIYCDNGKIVWVEESFELLKSALTDYFACEDLSSKRFGDDEQPLLCVVNRQMVESVVPCGKDSIAQYMIELKTNKKLYTNNTIA